MPTTITKKLVCRDYTFAPGTNVEYDITIANPTATAVVGTIIDNHPVLTSPVIATNALRNTDGTPAVWVFGDEITIPAGSTTQFRVEFTIPADAAECGPVSVTNWIRLFITGDDCFASIDAVADEGFVVGDDNDLTVPMDMSEDARLVLEHALIENMTDADWAELRDRLNGRGVTLLDIVNAALSVRAVAEAAL